MHRRIFAASSFFRDDSYGETVVAFGTDGLQRSGREARLTRHQLEHFAGARNGGIAAVAIGNGAVADYVVHDDQRSGTRKLDGPLEIPGVVGLVSVDKDEIERRASFFF